MKLATAATAAIETAINTYLRQDPEISAQLADLKGKVIALMLHGPNISLFFLPDTDGMHLLSSYEDEPDTQICGTPITLFCLGISRGEASSLLSNDIEIHGDIETGKRFHEILQSIDVDWEELLARVAGDQFARQVGNLGRHGKSFLGNAASSIQQDISEYIKEELCLLPATIEIENFLHDIDLLRNDTDRVEARIKRLQQTLNKGCNN